LNLGGEGVVPDRRGLNISSIYGRWQMVANMQIYPIDLSDPIDQFHGSNTEAGATCQRHLSVSIGWLKELTIIPREIETVSQSTLKHMVKKTKGYIIKVDKGHFLIDLLRNAVTQFK